MNELRVGCGIVFTIALFYSALTLASILLDWAVHVSQYYQEKYFPLEKQEENQENLLSLPIKRGDKRSE